MNQSFDISRRDLIFHDEPLHLCFINSLTDTLYLNQLIDGLLRLQNAKELSLALVNGSIEITKSGQRMKKMLYSGCSIITYQQVYYILETRSYPGRSVGQPDTEKTIRGAKDGFNENIIMNVGLIRRRIRDEHLVMEMHEVGQLSKSDICLCFMNNKADASLLNLLRRRLDQLCVDELVMSDRALEELLLGQSFHPFPFVRYCERPDIVASHLLQGDIAIIADTSSSVILLPIDLMDLLEHVEEHRETPFVGTLFRLIRLAAVIISIFLVPFWLTVIQTGHVQFRLFVTPEEENILQLTFQVFLVEGAIELLRLATIYTPSALSSAMGLIAAILVGQMAIDLGMFSPEVLLYCAISNVSGYACPNYELASANKLTKWLMILMVGFFGRYGFVLSFFLLFFYLAHLRPLDHPYFAPIIPFRGQKLLEYLIRLPKKPMR